MTYSNKLLQTINHLKGLIVCFFLCFFSGHIFGQILTLGGNNYSCDTAFVSNDSAYVCYFKKANIKKIRLDNVYSFKPNSTSKLVVLYKPENADDGNFYSKQEMFLHIKGLQDAKIDKKALGVFWANVGLGAISGYLLPISLSPLGIVPFTIVCTLPITKINKKKVSNKIFLAEESYLNGYAKGAKAKRINKSILGGFIGVAFGSVLQYVVAPKFLKK